MSRSLGMATVAILAALQRRVDYGLDITQETGLLAGTVYTTLRRLERRDLIVGHWEDAAVAEEERRPRRRYYRLTAKGENALQEARGRLGDLAAQAGVELPASGAGER